MSLLPASRLQFILIKNKKRRVGYESVLADLISKRRWDSFWWLCFKEYGNFSILRRDDIISFSSPLLNYFQSLWPLDFQVLQMILNIPRTMNQRLTRHLITLPVSPFHDSRQKKKKSKIGGVLKFLFFLQCSLLNLSFLKHPTTLLLSTVLPFQSLFFLYLYPFTLLDSCIRAFRDFWCSKFCIFPFSLKRMSQRSAYTSTVQKHLSYPIFIFKT